MELFKMSAKTKQKKRYYMDRSTLFAAALTSKSAPQTSGRSHVLWVERCSAGQLGPFGRMKDRRSRRCGGNGGRGLAITGRKMAVSGGGGRRCPEVVLSDALI